MEKTVRAVIARPMDAIALESGDATLPNNPFRNLAGAVLLQAWQDANCTVETLKYGYGPSPASVIYSARQFLTAKAPDPFGRQRQRYTSLLSIDDEMIRARCARVFGIED